MKKELELIPALVIAVALTFFLGMAVGSSWQMSEVHAQGGYSIVWEDELKRPEARNALSNWAMGHCHVRMYSYDFATLSKALANKSTSVPSEQFNLDCY
jgi:hypothetical protein